MKNMTFRMSDVTRFGVSSAFKPSFKPLLIYGGMAVRYYNSIEFTQIPMYTCRSLFFYHFWMTYTPTSPMFNSHHCPVVPTLSMRRQLLAVGFAAAFLMF